VEETTPVRLEASMTAHDAPDEVRFATELLFTDGLPQMDDEVGYRGAVAARAAGITYRQLDYWARTELVSPPSRSQRFGIAASVRLPRHPRALLVKRLLDTGISCSRSARRSSSCAAGIRDLAGTTLMSDGASVYLCTRTTRSSTSSAGSGRVRHRRRQGAARGRVDLLSTSIRRRRTPSTSSPLVAPSSPPERGAADPRPPRRLRRPLVDGVTGSQARCSPAEMRPVRMTRSSSASKSPASS
jgi:hypothetical protein